jgi:hypothetical protein
VLVAIPPLGCIGIPVRDCAEALQSDGDLRQFWRGYCLAGAACAALLIIEIIAIRLLF